MIDILFITYIVYLIHLAYTTAVPKADTTNPENHISPQDIYKNKKSLVFLNIFIR